MPDLKNDRTTTADIARQMDGRTGDEQKPADRPEPLMPQDRVEEYRGRWDRIQTGFVDEPRLAVEDADHLVADVLKQLANSFADARQQLEAQWMSGRDASTEELRQALRKYRAFFERLLSM